MSVGHAAPRPFGMHPLPSATADPPPLPAAPLLQHTELEARINELVDGSVEDVLMLAR